MNRQKNRKTEKKTTLKLTWILKNSKAHVPPFQMTTLWEKYYSLFLM